ncbi:hypothetical protein [Mesorhizobium sp. M0408]|uniref:hypothetical protein n=1 Tax=Mesorhizobium sp. M0408 TaxID=2956942 RepID=UPI0033392D9D
MAVDQRGPGRLHEERVGIAKQRLAKGLACCNRSAKVFNGQNPAIAGDLDIGFIGRSVLAEDNGNPCHAIVADDADFALPPTGHGGDYRCNAHLWKIHTLDRLICDLQLVFDVEFDVTLPGHRLQAIANDRSLRLGNFLRR